MCGDTMRYSGPSKKSYWSLAFLYKNAWYTVRAAPLAGFGAATAEQVHQNRRRSDALDAGPRPTPLSDGPQRGAATHCRTPPVSTSLVNGVGEEHLVPAHAAQRAQHTAMQRTGLPRHHGDLLFGQRSKGRLLRHRVVVGDDVIKCHGA